jgi:copper chaperone
MMLKSETFEIVGDQKLHCEGCENRVTRLVKGIPGVVRVRAQATNQRVAVQFDADVLNATNIADRLAQAGYEARIDPQAGGPAT